jgi:2-octaprenyl-6-methoxyphenol hydroxylase
MIDIVIIGGNHNGLTMAAMLANLPLNIVLIEKYNFKTQKKPGSAARLFAIASQSCELLSEYEIIDDIRGLSGLIKKIFCIDYDNNEDLIFDPQDVGESDFGCMIDEFDLSKHLHARVSKMDNITCYENVAVTHLENEKNKVHISLDNGQVITAKLVIACDGKNSAIRSMLGIETHEYDYKQIALVCDIKHKKKHNGLAVEKFMASGPFAVLPQKDPHTSSIVWTLSDSHYSSLKNMPLELLHELIAERLNEIFGDFEIVSEVGVFPLKKVSAKEYSFGRVALLGDALHAIHPLAGQGYNLSIRDADCLAKLIANQLDLGLDIGSQIMLTNFYKQRHGDNNLLIEATNFLNGVFAYRNPLIKLARGLGFKGINKIKPLKRMFIKYACGAIKL